MMEEVVVMVAVVVVVVVDGKKGDKESIPKMEGEIYQKKPLECNRGE